MLVVLRFFILAAVILLATSSHLGGRPGWIFWLFASVFLVSNFIYALGDVARFVSARITLWIFVFDVILVTILFGSSGIPQDALWIPYFLTILLAALAANLRVAIVAERTRRGGLDQALDLTNRIAGLFDLQCLIDLSRDPRGLARHILELSQELFSGDAGSLLLVDEKSGELRVAVTRGLDPIEGRADPEGIAAHILAHGEPLLLVGSLRDDLRFSNLEDRPDIRSSISVPIKYRDEIFGVLNFNRSHLPNFTNVDLQKAASFAVHVGVALANSKTFREMDEERLSTLDSLDDLRTDQAEAIRTEKWKSLEEVIGSLAQSLNDPLTGILGSAELAREKIPPDSGLRHSIDDLIADANRCRDIVAQLQGLQRLPKPSRLPADLVELVENVLYEHEDAMKRAGVVLITDYEPVVHLVAVDRHMMARVFAHLTENAITVMKTRTDTIRKLTVSITSVAGTCEVSVSDSGGGVRLDHLGSIFQPFFSTAQDGRHAGLGLSTAQRLVHENGGHMHATTDGVEGTTFVISLPACSAHQPRWGVDGKRQAPFAWPVGARSFLGRDSESNELGLALLIDADDSVGRIVGQALAGNHVVERAGSVDEALTALRASRQNGSTGYGVLLLDLSIPGGTELFLTLSHEFPVEASHLVLLTGAPPTAELSRLIDDSGCPYLAKPLDIHDLRDSVLTVLRS